MNTQSVNQEIKQLAISHGLCQQWQDEWDNEEGLERLLDKFYRGLDFYLKTRFVSTEQFQRFAPQEFLRKGNIIINERWSVLNPVRGIAIGNADVTIRCNARSVCQFTAVDNARLHIHLKSEAFIAVTLCDNASIESIETTGFPARIYVCRADEGTRSVTCENALIREKFGLYHR